MRKFLSITAIGAAALILGACQTELQKAEQQPMPQQTGAGTPFTQSLNKYYREAAESQWVGQTDFISSEHLAKKAQATGTGQAVPIDSIEVEGRAVKKNGELTITRKRFMVAMGRGAATKVPDQTARAQVAYDCWLAEASDPVVAVESKWLDKKVRNCRTDFYEAMAIVDAATKPRDKFVVYFDNDSAQIGENARLTLQEAAQTARSEAVNEVKVSIVGNADRTGKPAHNQMLSEKRAKEVQDSLLQGGVNQALIAAVEGRGEENPVVPTADGVAEPQNRNTIITLQWPPQPE
ncbi:MAG TPA: OmpA family protein [Alphaproteobacteria bacterium]|nr:OmpA family protein [Alphaproteobacteria bacterium]